MQCETNGVRFAPGNGPTQSSIVLRLSVSPTRPFADGVTRRRGGYAPDAEEADAAARPDRARRQRRRERLGNHPAGPCP